MVWTRPGNPLQAHFGRYTTPLYIAIATFGIGLLFGALATGTLTVADKLMLVDYVHRFVTRETARLAVGGIFQPMLVDNLKLLGLLYLLGISVAGMPLVVVIVFFRGFVLGFAGAFLVGTLHWQGFWLGVIAMGLADFFIVPAMLIVSGVALGMSWELISPKARMERSSLLRGLAHFTGLVLVMGLVTVAGSVAEAYVAPAIVHVLGGLGI